MFEHANSFCFDLYSWVDSYKPLPEFNDFCFVVDNRAKPLKAAVDNVTSYLGPNTRSMLFYGGCMNSWDVSKVTSMFKLFFQKTEFNVNIASWITDKVTSMEVSCFFQIFIRIDSFYII